MKLLIVCDAMEKFIKDSLTDKMVATRINNWIKQHEKKEGSYVIFLNRVVKRHTEKNKDLRAATMNHGSQIPPFTHEILYKPNTSVCFRKHLDPFQDSDPNFKDILDKLVEQLYQQHYDFFTEVFTLFINPSDKKTNQAVVKAFQQYKPFKGLAINRLMLTRYQDRKVHPKIC